MEKKPVNVNWQMVFVFIPFLDLYASYRIQKLRLWILIFLVGFGAAGILMDLAIYGDDYWNPDMKMSMMVEPAPHINGILFIIISIGLAIFLIRKWSIQWNENLANKN